MALVLDTVTSQLCSALIRRVTGPFGPLSRRLALGSLLLFPLPSLSWAGENYGILNVNVNTLQGLAAEAGPVYRDGGNTGLFISMEPGYFAHKAHLGVIRGTTVEDWPLLSRVSFIQVKMQVDRMGLREGRTYSGVEIGFSVLTVMLKLGAVVDRQNGRAIGLLGLGVGI